MVVIRRAAVEGRRPVGLAVGSTNGPVAADFRIPAHLIVAILVLHASYAVFYLAADHTNPETLLAFAVTQFTQTLIHIVVFLTPGHEVHCSKRGNGHVRLIRRIS